VLFETNAVGLAGMFNHDFAVQLVTEHVLSKIDAQLHHPPSLIRLMNLWLADRVDCGQSLRIGFLEDSDFMNKSELFHAAADAKNMGINAVVGHADQLKSGFVLDGAPIDVLLRDVPFRDLPAGPKKYPVLLQAINDGLVIPSTSAEFGHKGILECLTSPQFERFIPAEDRAFLKAVPWTRVICERETELPDGYGSLISFILAYKDGLLIKPNLDAGGESVLIGKDCSRNAWERRIKRALREKQQWAVQQFVPIFLASAAA